MAPRSDASGEVEPPMYIRGVRFICEPCTSDPFGLLRSARLEVEGTLVPFGVEYYRNPGTEYKDIAFLYDVTYAKRAKLKVEADVPLADEKGWFVSEGKFFWLPVDQGEYETTGLLLTQCGDRR